MIEFLEPRRPQPVSSFGTAQVALFQPHGLMRWLISFGMPWNQVIGPLLGAAIALLGFVVTQLFTGRRERKNRTNAHLSRLIEKRYELYLEYLDVLDQNVDVFTGDNRLDIDPDDLLQRLKPLERSMQVFGSAEVLAAFDQYRDCVRKMASWYELTARQRLDLRHEEHVASSLSLAAVRANLRIDSYDSWFARFRNRRRVHRLMKRRVTEFRRVAEPPSRGEVKDAGDISSQSGGDNKEDSGAAKRSPDRNVIS